MEILQIYPHKLVYDLKVLIQALNCGKPLDSQKFKEFTQNWLQEFHSNPKINWNILTPTMHLLMVHGHRIVELFPVPPGHMSEEGSERNVQTFRRDRAHFARQIPDENLGDCFKRQCQMSYPGTLRLLQSGPKLSKNEPLLPEAENLLAPQETYDLLVLESDDDSESVLESDSESKSDSDSDSKSETESEDSDANEMEID